MVLFDKIGLILFHFAWQAAAIAVITGLILYVLKGANSRVRYTLCCFSLLLMVTLPICFTFTNLIKDPNSFEGSTIKQLTPVDAKEVFSNGVLIATSFRTGQIQISSYEELVYYINRYFPLISIIWMLGVVLTACYRIYGFSKVRSLICQAQRVEESYWAEKIKELMRKTGLKQKITFPSISRDKHSGCYRIFKTCSSCSCFFFYWGRK